MADPFDMTREQTEMLGHAIDGRTLVTERGSPNDALWRKLEVEGLMKPVEGLFLGNLVGWTATDSAKTLAHLLRRATQQSGGPDA